MGDYLPVPGGSATNRLKAAETTIGSYRMCPETDVARLPPCLRVRT